MVPAVNKRGQYDNFNSILLSFAVVFWGRVYELL